MKTVSNFKLVFLASILVFSLYNGYSQYRASSSNGASIASGLSGVTNVNCDVRNYLTYPVTAIVWDGTSPTLYWEWNGNSNSISLPSTAVAPDVAVVYENNIVNEPYI